MKKNSANYLSSFSKTDLESISNLNQESSIPVSILAKLVRKERKEEKTRKFSKRKFFEN